MEFAKSLSGHDKNQYYFVLQKEDTSYLLVNGTNRPIEKPKKKNEKHLQIVKKLPLEVVQILGEEQNNLTIKKAIQTYIKMLEQKQEAN